MKLPILFQGQKVGEVNSDDEAAVSMLETWESTGAKMREQQREWVKMLKERGFSAAHPDDGWHERKNRKVFLCYPQFDNGVKVGDKIALGYPWEKTYRTIRVSSISHGILDPSMTYYHY